MIAIEHNIFTTTTKVRDKQEMKAKNMKNQKGCFQPKSYLHQNIKRAHRDLQHNDI